MSLHTLTAIESALGKTAQKEFLPGELLLTGLPGMIYLTGLSMQPGDVPKTEADVTDFSGKPRLQTGHAGTERD